MKLTVHIDGGARGNPGPAGAGVSMRDAQPGVVFEAGFYLGEMTNNQAEYGALLKALEVAERIGAEEIAVFADSELLVRQINGDYRVKNPGLKVLFGKAMERLGRLGAWRVQHVLRESNSRADELANMAMDAREDVIVRGVDDNDAVGRVDGAAHPKTLVVETGQLSFSSNEPNFHLVAAYYAGILGTFTLLTQCDSGKRPAIVELKDGDILTRLRTDQLTTAIKEGRLDAAKMLVFHGIMLLNTAYEWTKPKLEKLPKARRKSPLFEFFRHVRNGSSHGNRFHFIGKEPTDPAYWKGHTIEKNLEGKQVVGGFLSPAALPILLADVDAEL